MTNTPLVSILVGFFNAERFIVETISSVLHQTLDDWELILVDDGSSDGSSSIAQGLARENPEKIHYVTHEGRQNRGVCASRNLALRLARGQYIAILDADDVWLPQKLAQQVEILQANPRAGMTFGAARYWRSWSIPKTDTRRDYTPSPGIPVGTIHEPPTLLRRCHPLGRATAPCPSDLLARKDVVLSIQGFEEQFTGAYQMYEDQAFLAKVYVSTPVFASAKTWTLYRLHEGSCCHRVEASGQERHVRTFYLNWLRDYLRDNRIQETKAQRALSRALFRSQHPWADNLANMPGKVRQVVKSTMRRLVAINR
ncbi:MAG TPA: glycosyltransferase [Gammaproteobacteria bacterium]